MNLEELVAELRRLRAERDATLRAVAVGDRGATRRWLWVAARYDRALLRAAEMVGVAAPRLPKVRRLLGTHVRLALEADLEAAGLELGCEIAA